MQIRPLFAVLILGVAVGISHAQADKAAALEKLSLEELISGYFKALKKVDVKLRGKELHAAKLDLLKKIPDHPELRRKINLPIGKLYDLVIETYLEDIRKWSPKLKAQEKKKFIAGLLEYLNNDSEEAENDGDENEYEEEAENEDY